jgi:hypothetical protein
VKANAFKRLNRAVFANSSRDTLDQLVSVRLHPLCFTFYLLGVH